VVISVIFQAAAFRAPEPDPSPNTRETNDEEHVA